MRIIIPFTNKKLTSEITRIGIKQSLLGNYGAFHKDIFPKEYYATNVYISYANYIMQLKDKKTLLEIQIKLMKYDN